jgi:hypothetical protein
MEESLAERIEVDEIEFLLSPVRVTFKLSIGEIDAGEIKLKQTNQGETVELPRWAAEELEKKSIAEIVEEPFETEVFKALSREKILGPLQLSKLPQTFYMRMRRRLSYLRNEASQGRVRRDEFERFRASCYDIVSLRIGKLLSLANASANMPDVIDKLTHEERELFNSVQSASKRWKSMMLGES